MFIYILSLIISYVNMKFNSNIDNPISQPQPSDVRDISKKFAFLLKCYKLTKWTIENCRYVNTSRIIMIL